MDDFGMSMVNRAHEIVDQLKRIVKALEKKIMNLCKRV